MPAGPNGATIVWFENPLSTENPTAFGWTKHTIGTNRGQDVEVADLNNDGLIEVIARGKGGFANSQPIVRGIHAVSSHRIGLVDVQ